MGTTLEVAGPLSPDGKQLARAPLDVGAELVETVGLPGVVVVLTVIPASKLLPEERFADVTAGIKLLLMLLGLMVQGAGSNELEGQLAARLSAAARFSNLKEASPGDLNIYVSISWAY